MYQLKKIELTGLKCLNVIFPLFLAFIQVLTFDYWFIYFIQKYKYVISPHIYNKYIVHNIMSFGNEWLIQKAWPNPPSFAKRLF